MPDPVTETAFDDPTARSDWYAEAPLDSAEVGKLDSTSRNPHDLKLLRASALKAQALLIKAEKDKQESPKLLNDPLVRENARKWLRFLLNESAKTSFLQRWQGADTTFYDEQTLRPMPRQEWKNGWKYKLSWLDSPAQDLTIAELELALAIFEWTSHNRGLSGGWIPISYPVSSRFCGNATAGRC